MCHSWSWLQSLLPSNEEFEVLSTRANTPTNHFSCRNLTHTCAPTSTDPQCTHVVVWLCSLKLYVQCVHEEWPRPLSTGVPCVTLTMYIHTVTSQLWNDFKHSLPPRCTWQCRLPCSLNYAQIITKPANKQRINTLFISMHVQKHFIGYHTLVHLYAWVCVHIAHH